MKAELTVAERDSIFQRLSEEQRQFLHHDMLRSRRTIFAQMMVRAKGASIPEDASYEDVERFLDGWVYTGYRDAGEPSPDYPCECGRPLRYQHEVKHKTTGAIMHFGIVHLGEHLQLDAKTVSLIVKGFDVLDKELDEILVKCRGGWSLEAALSFSIPNDFSFPKDILAHLELQLPLLDKQIARLQKKIIQFIEERSIRHALSDRVNETFRVPSPAPEFVLEDEQIALLFPDERRSAPESIDHNSQMQYKGSEVLLQEDLKDRVKELLRTGTQSARVMAEILLTEGADDQRRYSSGKPHLYVPLCIFMDQVLVPAGFCQLIYRSTEDRHYQFVK